MPAFKCKNNDCTGSTDRNGDPGPWFTWSATEFDTADYTNGAKADVLAAVTSIGEDVVLEDLRTDGTLDELETIIGPERWPSLTEMLADADTRASAVGYLVWTWLLETASREGKPLIAGDGATKIERQTIARAAKDLLGVPDDDQADRDYGDGYY